MAINQEKNIVLYQPHTAKEFMVEIKYHKTIQPINNNNKFIVRFLIFFFSNNADAKIKPRKNARTPTG